MYTRGARQDPTRRTRSFVLGSFFGFTKSNTEHGARWANRSELAPLRVSARDLAVSGRLVLGVAGQGRRRPTTVRRHPTRALLAAEASQSVAIIGPTQSGKTTGFAIPAILGWGGPVLAVSVKTDLLRDTYRWRRRCGLVWCFDPTSATGLASNGWSPLPAARTWAGARRAAADLTEVTRAGSTSADGDFWYATAAKLLAPLLFAASTGGKEMADVVRWVDTQEVAEVVDLLEASSVPEALHAAWATFGRDDRQRSAVYTTAETVLEPFADGVCARADDIDVAVLLDGSNTLYLCAPAHDQRRLRSIFTAIVKQVVEAAFTRSARSGRALRPPLLVVLDEAANIAPLAELDGLAATCASHGVQLVTVWQDLAQLSARYGARAATVINNHRARIFLSGIADPGTLDHASHLVGDQEVRVPSVTRDATGGRSTTTALLRRRLLPPEALRQLVPGNGVLVYGSLPPVKLALQPWWLDARLRERGGYSAEDDRLDDEPGDFGAVGSHRSVRSYPPAQRRQGPIHG